MTSRVSWSVEGIEPSARERAEAAARRAGMSLGDWLNAAIGSAPNPDAGRREARDIAEIHDRLDAITRQVEQLAGPRTPPRGDPALAHQLNDAISRLDARLSLLSPSSPPRAAAPAAATVAATPLPPVDFSVAEIIARQNELDGEADGHAPRLPPQMTAPLAPDFSNLERQLVAITSQIETLRAPDGIEESITTFRAELADIRIAITEALPRHAIESLEGEIRSLGRRIDESHQRGADGTALAGIERALSEIHGELRGLTPAEQLAGFDEAIHNLGGKIDTIVRTSQDPGTLRQLDEAISALKTIVAGIASNEAIAQIADNLHTLSQKVDQLAQASGSGDILAALEQRIAVLTTALEQRERPAPADASHFDDAMRTLSDRLDQLQIGNDSSAALAHVEQRVTRLLERLEDSERPAADLGRVEQGLSEVKLLLKQQRDSTDGAAAPSSIAMDPDSVAAIRRELSDMRFSQSETVRQTQDSLEAVHNTLGHVVDRLAFIEGDLRERRIAAAAPAADPLPSAAPPAAVRAADSIPPQTRPELPNPALAQAQMPLRPDPGPQSPSAGAGQTALREQTAKTATTKTTVAKAATTTQATTTRTAATKAAATGAAAAEAMIAASAKAPETASRHMPRTPIDPDLPPDHPLEPGSRLPPGRTAPSAAERIAASESALSDIAPGPSSSVSSSNFIQAARRAAQAAQNAAATQAPNTKPNRVSVLNEAARAAQSAPAAASSPVGAKIRAALVGVSVVVIVLGTVKMTMNLLSSGDPTKSAPAAETSVAPQLSPPPAVRESPAPADDPPSTAPSMTSPVPIGKQSLNATTGSALPSWAGNVTISSPPALDVTGAIATPPAETAKPGTLAAREQTSASASASDIAAAAEALPDAIGGPLLRDAARRGEAGAAYEIGLRYAEGRGVTQNFSEAAKWYQHAAQAQIVPAMFRLGTLYEKGLGLKKDLDAAGRQYRQAAERGNAKAMHNLAVLEADGGGKPDYKGASSWFRKAAERGIADSQFNLGILYARGIGVEQNLAESYKWFSLAAAQGDTDSGYKRDEIAKRLDAQSLAAAKLAIQTFTPQPQPAEALDVAAPAGGWDALPPKAATKGVKNTRTARNAKAGAMNGTAH